MNEREELEALRRMAELEAKERAAVNPAGTSFLGNLPAATGMGVAKLARPVGQALGMLDQADIDEANRLDKPLENAPGGTTGKVTGQLVTAGLLSRLPGANTMPGAMLLGGNMGAWTTAGGAAERAGGAALGAVGGAVGKYVGDKVAQGAGWLTGKIADGFASRQAANAGKDAAAAAAREAGYKLPPVDTNPNMMNQVLNGVSGKIKTAQQASFENQGLTNSLAKKAVGVADDAPLSVEALNAVRKQAGQAYEAVAGTGMVKPGPQYAAALDKIAAPYLKAAQGFPGSKPPPVLAEIESLRTGQFDAGSGIAKLRAIREAADSAYASGDKITGNALKEGAKALEDALENHVAKLGQPELLTAFRGARQLIAKTYSVQKGLNDTTGDVAASALAAQLKRGKPLSGELETIARTGQAFPKATQSLREAPGAVSPLDAAVAVTSGAATGNPMAAVMMGARPAVRSLLLSKAYQNTMGKPSYDPNVMTRILLEGAQNPALNRMMGPLTSLATLEANR